MAEPAPPVAQPGPDVRKLRALAARIVESRSKWWDEFPTSSHTPTSQDESDLIAACHPEHLVIICDRLDAATALLREALPAIEVHTPTIKIRNRIRAFLGGQE